MSLKISQSEKQQILEMHKSAVLNEQTTQPKKGYINGYKYPEKITTTAEQLLKNNWTKLYYPIGITEDRLNDCFKFAVQNNSPSTFGVGGREIDLYVDYLNIYGKVPGTNIPIPYEGNDLNDFIQILQGTGIARNLAIYGSIEERITGQDVGNGIKVWYPAVDLIRASYNSREGGTLWEDLGEKLTDSDEDKKKKNQIKSMLLNAYQVWIDCYNGKRKNVK